MLNMRRNQSSCKSHVLACVTPVLLLLAGVYLGGTAFAQTIQPVIQEYIAKADGKFEVTNNTLTPMAIVLEPRSFSITADGRGVYRPLDSSIHVKLSTTSLRLEPKQTYYVFYKATSDTLPAWFTVYASFSAVKSDDGVKVRIMLPHTVYLYQKKPISKDSVQVTDATYVEDNGKITCDLKNTGQSLVRVQDVRAMTGKTTVTAAGFPLLPGGSRHLSFDWKEKGKPEYLLIHFPRFDVKEPLATKDQ